MQNRHMLLVCLLLTLALTGFIWTNSLQSKESSLAHSGMLLKLVQPWLNSQGTISEEVLHHWVRKGAHFAEFGALGMSVGGLCVCLGKTRSRRYYALPILLVLFVAVVDEYIQFFSGRGSLVTDVVLDFSGGMTGLALIVCGILTGKWIRYLRNKHC